MSVKKNEGVMASILFSSLSLFPLAGCAEEENDEQEFGSGGNGDGDGDETGNGDGDGDGTGNGDGDGDGTGNGDGDGDGNCDAITSTGTSVGDIMPDLVGFEEDESEWNLHSLCNNAVLVNLTASW